jgi:hypothetical protein
MAACRWADLYPSLPPPLPPPGVGWVEQQIVEHPLAASRGPLKELNLLGNTEVEQVLHQLIHDTLRTQVSVQYSTQELACAIVFLAANYRKRLPEV